MLILFFNNFKFCYEECFTKQTKLAASYKKIKKCYHKVFDSCKLAMTSLIQKVSF